jgi:hypothetical protein
VRAFRVRGHDPFASQDLFFELCWVEVPIRRLTKADPLVVEEIGDAEMIPQVKSRACRIELAVPTSELSHDMVVIKLSILTSGWKA